MTPTTVYIDHNVLDFLSKGRLPSVKNRLIQKEVQLVYSSCNLEEIHRTTNETLRESFLNCLDSLNAVHFWTDDNDEVHFSQVTVNESYLTHVQNKRTFGNPEEIIQGFLFKMYGGQMDDSFQTIFSTGEAKFDDLLELVLGHVDEAGLSQSEHKFFVSQVEMMRGKFKKESDELMMKLEKDHGKGVGFSMIEDVREFTGMGPIQLNNIEPPRVMEQIWSVLSSSKGFPSDVVTFESLFGKEGVLEQSLPHPSRFNRVNGLYGLLNTIGYYSDPKLARQANFLASLGDDQHAGHASHTDEVLSRDLRFVKKAYAVYEHFGISTMVTFIET